jgi:hypothetical protein
MKLAEIEEVRKLCDKYYYDNPSGGSLHIVLDDGNMGNHHLEFCLEEARKNDDPDAVEIALKILDLTATERTKLFSLYPYESN